MYLLIVSYLDLNLQGFCFRFAKLRRIVTLPFLAPPVVSQPPTSVTPSSKKTQSVPTSSNEVSSRLPLIVSSYHCSFKHWFLPMRPPSAKEVAVNKKAVSSIRAEKRRSSDLLFFFSFPILFFSSCYFEPLDRCCRLLDSHLLISFALLQYSSSAFFFDVFSVSLFFDAATTSIRHSLSSRRRYRCRLASIDRSS